MAADFGTEGMFDIEASPSEPFDLARGQASRKGSPIPGGETIVDGDGDADVPLLDGEDVHKLHGTLLGHYRRELDRQYNNRIEQAIDEDFYDHIQWDENDARQLRERGQMPLCYNVIATTLNWVIGTEKRQRVDYKVLPRRKDEGKTAERKTALLKYLSDVNREPFARSRAFADAVKIGVGWLECGAEESASGDPVYSRYESWRNMLWDSAATEQDLSDARYIARAKWVDADLMRAMFKDRTTLIDESIDDTPIYDTGVESDGDWAMDSHEVENQQGGMLRGTVLGPTRPRLRVIEMWFRRPIDSHRMIGGSFGGDVYDWSAAHDREIQTGRARIERTPVMRMHVALFTAKGMLWLSPSPYRHNRYPFTPIWAHRRGRDGMPYGMVRGLRDIQFDINKRASKALFILSSNKVIMDEDALPDDVSMKEFQQEVARPDAIIRKRKGAALQLDADRDLAASHLELMSRSIAFIQSQSGVTDESMGRQTNAVSGIAIGRRQDQGGIATINLFDQLRFAMQVHGEKELSLVEQFYTEAKDFRITGMRGNAQYVTVNSGLPDDDITRSKADFIISEADWHATLRQSAVEALFKAMGFLGKVAPQVAIAMVDLVVENMDLPNRAEIVSRIRAATGMPDPDTDTPTQEMAMAAKKRQIKEALELATAQAEVQIKQATAAKAAAQAKQLLAKAIGQGVDTQGAAIKAALELLEESHGGAAPIADQFLQEAGFQGAPEQQAQALAVRQAQAARTLIAQRQQQQRAISQQGTAPGIAGQQQSQPPASPPPPALPHGARQAPDGHYYVPDPHRPGKFLMVQHG